MKKKHVKIVLPCTNEGEWLRLTVDSILENTDYPSFEIHVLLNGDELTDTRFAEGSRYRAHVRLERFKDLLGVGESVNRAVTPGDAEYYVFLDAHCLVEDEEWLARVVDCLDRNPDASMVQPEVVQFRYEQELKPGEPVDPAAMQEEGTAYAILWSWPYERPWDLAEVVTHSTRRTTFEAMAGGGMAVFVRAGTFHRLGRYDGEIRGWYPETMDYCVRAWMLGHPMLVDPGIRVLHRVKAKPPYRRNGIDLIHGILRTCYKYLSPRRRELAEILFRRHGLEPEVQASLERIHRGRWLEERAEHLRSRIHDDDWLFEKFEVYEERFGIHVS